MKIGLFFGSFNPIHIGHLIIAQSYLNDSDCDQIWLMVSPHNPLKEKNTLLNENERLHLCELAVEDHDKIFASNFEFMLPKPSYTIDTLSALVAQFRNYEFSILMGSDNLINIHKWKNYEAILKYYPIYVYPRPEAPVIQIPEGKVSIIDAPLLDISASRIRNLLQQNKSIHYMVTKSVQEYIESGNLYKKKH